MILMIFLLGIGLLVALRHLIDGSTHGARCVSNVVDRPLRLPMQPLLLAAGHAHMIFQLYFKAIWLQFRRVLLVIDFFQLFLWFLGRLLSDSRDDYSVAFSLIG